MNEVIIKATIYDIIAIGSTMNTYTVLLAEKMNSYARENNLKIYVGSDAIGHIDESGEDTDVILLAPECYSMKEEIKDKFPNKNVIVIDRVEYGTLQVKKIINMIKL